LTQKLTKNISEKLKSTEEKLEAKTATLNQENALKRESDEIISKKLAKFDFKFKNDGVPLKAFISS
jgi:hypothetical protein